MTDASPPTNPSLARWANQSFAYLTTFGRRTSRPHRIEIWFALEANTIYLLSGGRDRSDWVRNLQANPRVTVELGPKTLIGSARLPQPDSPEDRRARELLVTKYQQDNNLDEWGRTSLAVIIDLAPTEKTHATN